MNILIPHTWLLEHLDTSATPQEIQKYLSLSGPSVERIYDIEGESVYDIEVTTNRVDCMSIRGIAREAAVILTQAGIPSTLKSPKLQELGAGKVSAAGLHIENDPTLCARVLAIVIKDVKRVHSPEWMQKRLRQIGVNVHDVVIDITNYITHEYGHPCHAFDYDKLLKESGGVIRIVEAKKGQSFAIIDGTKYTTLGGEVVFEGKSGEIIDLPAIKGTANTSIDDHTKNVCFWIESLDHQKVRFASMAHAIRTVAAQLEEKDLSPELADDTFARGVELYQELAGGVIENDSLIDVYPGKPSSTSIQMHLQKFVQYLGLEIPVERITSILHVLGCETELHGQMLTVIPPLWRTDLHIPEDIVEEIARIYGYHNIPSSLMTGEIPTSRPSDTNFALEHQVKELFASLGGQEVYTYSMVSEATATLESRFVLSALEESKSDLEKTHLHLKNPLTDDMVYLRRTLWASHLPILQTPQGEERVLFELANAYIPSTHKETTLPFEELHLTLTTVQDMRLIKGYADTLIRSLYLEPIHYKVAKTTEATMWSGKTQIGHTLVVETGKKAVSVVDLNWKAILGIAKKYPQVQPIPKLSPIIEDMTFVMPNGIHTQTVREAIHAQSKLVRSVAIKDIYQANVTFTVTYQPEQEMSADDIAPIRRSIVEHLEKEGLKLVGKVA